MEHLWLWIGFGTIIAGSLAVDLGVVNRRPHVPSIREALGWSLVWVLLALGFDAAVLVWRGPVPALEFLTGYVIELSLSVDNLFVFIMLFAQFGVPAKFQHRVLFWGVFGAMVMRGAMILAGAALVSHFHWVLYLFGAFLIVTGARLLLGGDAEEKSPADNPAIAWLRRHLPVSDTAHDGRFLIVEQGRLMATPLFVVLMTVEIADVMFAVDSVPAIFAVTTDPFIVATSNIFAIMGLRSLYFALRGLVERLCYLRHGLSVVLMFIGAKLLLVEIYKIPIGWALGATAGILGVAVVASLRATAGQEVVAAEPPGEAAP